MGGFVRRVVSIAMAFAAMGLSAIASGQGLTVSQTDNACLAAIGSIGRLERDQNRSAKLPAWQQQVEDFVSQPSLPGHLFFRLAELMKRVGDYRARLYYEKAIAAEPDEPCYEAFYADYLRNFRGATTSLFADAEDHYVRALAKLARRREPTYATTDQLTRRYVDRGLSALYIDGVTLISRSTSSAPSSNDASFSPPLLSFGTTDRFSLSAADLDEEADVRDYTTEAAIAEARAHRPLSAAELEGLIRTKGAAETLDRLRLRAGHWPSVDLLYGYRRTTEAQITSFNTPDVFNDLRLTRIGLGAEHRFTVANQFDALFGGSFEVDRRFGLLETRPNDEERIHSFTARGAVSRFVGPDKLTATVTATHQGITDVANSQSPARTRNLVGTTLTYSIYRDLPFMSPVYQQRFETRGWDLSAGLLHDTESFPPILVRRRDYFVGTSLKGLWRFDFTVQPTWFTADLSNDPLQRNSQYRTYVTTLFRIVDEERHGGIPDEREGLHVAFVHLVVPIRRDVAVTGETAFENVKAGAGLDIKLYSYARWTTLLVSVRYDDQQFLRLDVHKRQFTLNLSLGL